eukprot:Hpha_TRINITY_DN24551_c0_g1::TRINITY_DN24551_c0_g1_i1::g.172596::m.172596/K20800/DPCD; protein DPCD
MADPFYLRQGLVATGPKSALVQDGRKKVHSSFMDGTELVEEFDVVTDQLIVRKWRKPGTLGGEGNWVYEVGGERPEAQKAAPGSDLMRPSATQPVVVRKDTATHFEWRIRNLPPPKENYKVSVEGPCVVVRTENRKYFKKLDVPDMARMGLPLENGAVEWNHAHSTLVVGYKKPQKVLDQEKTAAKERAAMKAERPGEDGSQCTHQ